MIITPSDGMTSGSINLKTGSPSQFGNGVGGDFSVSTGSGGPLSLSVEPSSVSKGGDATMKAGSAIASNDGGDLLIASRSPSSGVVMHNCMQDHPSRVAGGLSLSGEAPLFFKKVVTLCLGRDRLRPDPGAKQQ